MNKLVSPEQRMEIASRLVTQVDWTELDGDKIQREVISLPPKEFGRRFTAFLKAGINLTSGTGLTVGSFKIAPITHDIHGWKCVLPAQNQSSEFNAVLYEVLPGQAGKPDTIEETVAHLKNNGRNTTGLQHAEAMYRGYEKIPADWRKYALIFPEIWDDRLHDHMVPCLLWVENTHWKLIFNFAFNSFTQECRLVGIEK